MKIIKGRYYKTNNGTEIIVKATSNSNETTFRGILVEDPNNLYPQWLNKSTPDWNSYVFAEIEYTAPSNDLFPIY